MRNLVACVSCRAAKRQCVYTNVPPCNRCKKKDQACLFSETRPSHLYHQRRTDRATHGETANNSTLLAQGETARPSSRAIVTPRKHLELNHAQGAIRDLSLRSPYDFFTDEVKNNFLRCSYKWSFYHVPTLLRRVHERNVEEQIMWAILALAIRFSKEAPVPYTTPLEASNAFAAHAKAMVLKQVEEATLSSIQVLLMITGHSWGAGEGHRAWMYLGMAVRMAQILGLFDEVPEGSIAHEYNNLRAQQEAFIKAEERRRTAWTCFLMDSLLSGGKRRRRLLSAGDVHIQLPCTADDFHFADPVRCEELNGALSDHGSLVPVAQLGIVAYSMRIADVWGRIARWACSSAVHGELPWELGTEFQHLLEQLDQWRDSLPRRLEFSITSLHAHSASDNGQAYCYMHSIFFMSIMFLHRSYLSHIEAQNEHDSDSPLDRRWRDWQLQSRRELLEVAVQVCDMYKEMREFGLGFLCGLVPWIGFTCYTAVGIMLYCYQFPESTDRVEVMCRAKDRIINGCELLKDMRGSWPMADQWRETIKRMQIFYTNIQSKGVHGVSHMERQAMQQAVVDYGALQSDSGLHKKIYQSCSPEEYGTSKDSVTGQRHHSSAVPAIPNASVTMRLSGAVPQPEPEAALMNIDVFDPSFSITDDNMELLLSNVTQDFWAHFPGEVELV